MMKKIAIEDVLIHDEIYEKHIKSMFDKYLVKKANEEEFIVNSIFNDTVDLCKILSVDEYMFNLAYNNYNNGYSFMPQYYFASAVIHNVMIWERILILIGIGYKIEFEEIFKNKNIDALYSKIKKDESIEPELKELLSKIYGNNDFRELKEVRNYNEHSISSHLDNKGVELGRDLLKDLFYKDEQGYLKVNLEKFRESEIEADKQSSKKLSEKVKKLNKIQENYKLIIDKCIVKIGEQFQNNCIEFKEIEHFKYNYIFSFNVEKDFLFYGVKIEQCLGNHREKIREMYNIINSNPIIPIDKSLETRNTLLEDAVFRLKEISRTVNFYNEFLNEEIHKDKQLEYDIDENSAKYIRNELINNMYYFDIIVIRLQSIYEKIGKYIVCKYDFDGMFSDAKSMKKIDLDAILQMNIDHYVYNDFKRIIISENYRSYNEIRNKYYHCVRLRYMTEDLGFEFGIINLCYELIIDLIDFLDLAIDDECSIYTGLAELLNKK